MSGDSSLHWKETFLQVMNESDREKLHRLVHEAELAISLRLEELRGSADSREELSKIAFAIRALGSIRVQQLRGRRPRASSDGGRMAEARNRADRGV
jgi:hypothetical protein